MPDLMVPLTLNFMACTKNERYDISPKSLVAWENITGGLEFDSN